MDGLGKRRKIRGGHRSYVRKVVFKSNEALKNVETLQSEHGRLELAQFKMTLTEKSATLTELDDQILELLCSKEGETDEAIAAETEEAGELRAEITQLVLAIEEVLSSSSPDSSQQQEPPQIPSSLITKPKKAVHAKLPKLESQRQGTRMAGILGLFCECDS